MKKSFESLGRSRNLDIPNNPEDIASYTDKPKSFRDYMKELKELKDSLSSLPTEENDDVTSGNDEKHEQYIDEARKAVLEVFNKNKESSGEANFQKYKTIWESEKAAADKSCLNHETGRYEKGYAAIPSEAMEFVEHRRKIAQKQANGEEMTMLEKMEAGRDGIMYEWNGYKLRPDCCYRKITKEALKQYQESGFVDNNIDLKTMNRRDGTKIKGRVDTVDWFLGATTPRYGDILIEAPALEEYFIPVENPGESNMLTDTEAIHMHSSGIVSPIPMSEVRVIRGWQDSTDDEVREMLKKGDISLSDFSSTF